MDHRRARHAPGRPPAGLRERERPVGLLDVDGWITGLLAKKSDQHEGFAKRAILVIVMSPGDTEVLLERLRARANELPWWRVYLVWPQPAALTIAVERRAT